jgi:creatinine amidohydrolase
VEKYLERDDRAVLPIGSIEQHAYLSLATDSILAERVAIEAAEPLGVPVFPAIAYGITPSFRAYPGTVSLRLETLVAVVYDALDSLAGSGFRRILLVNGHGGNQPIGAAVTEWSEAHSGIAVKLHHWWKAPKVWKKVQEIDPVASHASWMENFPWTRMDGVRMPGGQKPMIDFARLGTLDPAGTREYLGDGNFGGRYQRGDDEVFALWRVAVEEARELIESGW